MGVDLKDWLEYVKDHPLLYRFEGLHSRCSSRKRDFHKTVGDAACSNEAFMNDFMYKEEASLRECFDKAVKDREDHDEMLSHFAEFCEHKVSHRRWVDKGLLTYDWRTAPLEAVLAVVDAFGSDDSMVDEYIRDWVMNPIDSYWDMIRSDEELINEHPPVAVWYHAGEYEILLEDVFFVCPACHGEPQTEECLKEFYGTKNGYPVFYCGSCGSEMCVDKRQDIRDFFIAMDIEPYPFNPVKKAEWKAILDARREMGENSMELKVGERVVLYKHVRDSDGNWSYGRDPGDEVEVTKVIPHTTRNSETDVTTHAGIWWHRTDEDGESSGYSSFHHVHSRAALPVAS